MGGIQGDVTKLEMVQCNFSLPKIVYEEYRAFCKERGIPMNFPVALFIQQFYSSELTLKIEHSPGAFDVYGIKRKTSERKEFIIQDAMIKRIAMTGDYRFLGNTNESLLTDKNEQKADLETRFKELAAEFREIEAECRRSNKELASAAIRLKVQSKVSALMAEGKSIDEIMKMLEAKEEQESEDKD